MALAVSLSWITFVATLTAWSLHQDVIDKVTILVFGKTVSSAQASPSFPIDTMSVLQYSIGQSWEYSIIFASFWKQINRLVKQIPSSSSPSFHEHLMGILLLYFSWNGDYRKYHRLYQSPTPLTKYHLTLALIPFHLLSHFSAVLR